MSYIDKLDGWFQHEKAAGRVVDMKLFPMDPDSSPELTAKAIFETVIGSRKSNRLDISKY